MNRRPKYAVISVADDAHIPFVQKHLDEPFVLLDWTQIPNGLDATYTFAHGHFVLRWGAYDLSHLRGIWYRRPELITPELLGMQGPKAAYAAGALRQLNALLLTYAPAATWISDYYALRRSYNKTLQLELAARLGFTVPDTVITSSAARARAFVERYPAVIVKPIDVQLFKQSGKESLFLARKVNKTTIRYEGLHLAPAIFQQAVDVAIDIRVTVVANKAFAATVTGSAVDDDSSTVRDWRIANHTGSLVITAHNLPDTIAKLCVAHVHELGLQFGAIDLILDKKGTYWFLENNPNGQWGFVEEATGQPIGEAIARLLQH